MVHQLSELDIKVIEIVGSFTILAVFIILFALVGSIPFIKDWTNIAYVLVFLGFIASMCLFGLKLSPRLSQ